MRSLPGLLAALLLALPLWADVVAGRTSILFHDRWVPIPGGPVTPLGRPVASAAFDGERFLTAWRDGDLVWLGLFDEGATVPFSATSLTVPGYSTPFVRWNGSMFVVVIEGSPTHLGLVSRQGVVETLVTIPPGAAIVDVAASASGIALVSKYPTSIYSSVIDVLLLDSRFEVVKRTLIGSIQRSTGFGTTYLATPVIAPFGEGFYVAWRQGRTARYDEVVGTRVLLDGSAPDIRSSTHEPRSTSGALLETSFEVPHTIQLHPYGPRLALEVIREYGEGLTTTFIDRDGRPVQSNRRMSMYGMPTNVRTVRMLDGSIAVAWLRDNGEGATLTLVPRPGPVRRRSV